MSQDPQHIVSVLSPLQTSHCQCTCPGVSRQDTDFVPTGHVQRVTFLRRTKTHGYTSWLSEQTHNLGNTQLCSIARSIVGNEGVKTSSQPRKVTGDGFGKNGIRQRKER